MLKEGPAHAGAAGTAVPSTTTAVALLTRLDCCSSPLTGLHALALPLQSLLFQMELKVVFKNVSQTPSLSCSKPSTDPDRKTKTYLNGGKLWGHYLTHLRSQTEGPPAILGISGWDVIREAQPYLQNLDLVNSMRFASYDIRTH